MHCKIVNVKNRHCRLPYQQKMALFRKKRITVPDRQATAKVVEGNKGEAYLFKWERGKWGALLGTKSPLEETGNPAVAGGGRRMRKALPGVVSTYKVKTL